MVWGMGLCWNEATVNLTELAYILHSSLTAREHCLSQQVRPVMVDCSRSVMENCIGQTCRCIMHCMHTCMFGIRQHVQRYRTTGWFKLASRSLPVDGRTHNTTGTQRSMRNDAASCAVAVHVVSPARRVDTPASQLAPPCCLGRHWVFNSSIFMCFQIFPLCSVF